MAEIEKLARLLTGYSVTVREGHEVLINSNVLGMPLVEAVYAEVLRHGGTPHLQIDSERLQDAFMALADERLLTHLSPIDKFLAEKVDVLIAILAQSNTRHFSNLNPERLKVRAASQRPLREIRMKREAEGKYQWTIAPYPTDAMAQEAQMSSEEYERFVFSSCLVTRDDPISEWKKISANQQKTVDFLNGTSVLRFVGEDTDLTLSTKGRKWVNCDGRANMPDGEIFTGPIEDSAEGRIRFTYPALYQGKEVEDVRLSFQKGKVVRAEAQKGEDLLKQMISVDEGARLIGEIAIGTNPGITTFTRNMLFDEKMGGTMHLALGRAYPETGSTNMSAIHWDLLKDMKGGEIYADGVLFYKNGKVIL